MQLPRVRRRCESKLRELALPSPFDVRTFCRSVARRRVRAIVLRPMFGGGVIYGAWAATADVDFIFYEGGTTVLHQDHIILHEICHLLWDHRPVLAADEDIARMLFPHLDSATIRIVLGRRVGYSAEEEQEAELLASLIFEHAAHVPSEGGAGESAVLARLGTALERAPQGLA